MRAAELLLCKPKGENCRILLTHLINTIPFDRHITQKTNQTKSFIMPQMNHKGPEGEGPKTGRKLGYCSSDDTPNESLLGKGMGKRRKMDGGNGKGKRLRYNQHIEK